VSLTNELDLSWSCSFVELVQTEDAWIRFYGSVSLSKSGSIKIES
jgi:hypothetical protein